ncbi:MAG: galactose oxidase [Thermoproteota archaeon]|nr:galactose oxidase [Thermoproteota archaeon]
MVIVFDFSISMAQTTTTTTTESFWTDGAPMPTPRTEVTAAVLEDDIYVIGGVDESGQVTDIVEVYNIANNTWSKAAAPLPEPLHHTASASYSGKIYVVGGYTAAGSLSDRSPSNRLFIYDPVQNSWQEGNPMPTARGALNVNFVNGTLYAIGGYSDRPLNSNEAYDPSSDTWTSKALMPTARHHAGSAVVDDKIFVIGGRISDSSENLSVNEAYDPEQDIWITNLEAMPSKRSGIAAVAAAASAAATADNASSINASNIYVFGGEEPLRTFNNNEKYDATTNKWTSEPPMPTARHGLVAVYMEDDKIYVIGGGPQPGLSVSGANEIFHVR